LDNIFRKKKINNFSLKATVDGEEVRRSYTPTLTGVGFFDLVLKIYPQGKMTNFVDQLKIGDKIDVRYFNIIK
jgi:cytochrome-b5 reductase